MTKLIWWGLLGVSAGIVVLSVGTAAIWGDNDARRMGEFAGMISICGLLVGRVVGRQDVTSRKQEEE